MSDLIYKANLKRLTLKKEIKQFEIEVAKSELKLLEFEIENIVNGTRFDYSGADAVKENEIIKDKVSHEETNLTTLKDVQIKNSFSEEDINFIEDEINNFGNMIKIAEENQRKQKQITQPINLDFTNLVQEQKESSFKINQDAYNKLLD